MFLIEGLFVIVFGGYLFVCVMEWIDDVVWLIDMEKWMIYVEMV